MDISALNGFAIIVAAVSAFVLGGLWYGPLFGKLTLLAAFGLAMLLQLHPAPGLVSGLSAGALVGVAFAATTTGINYLFAQKTRALFLIDAGYMVAMLAIMGAILGIWR